MILGYESGVTPGSQSGSSSIGVIHGFVDDADGVSGPTERLDFMIVPSLIPYPC